MENWSRLLPHSVEQDLFATLLRINCAAVLALEARPQDAAAGAETPLNARGWRERLNRTLAAKTLRHDLPRLLLAIERVGSGRAIAFFDRHRTHAVTA